MYTITQAVFYHKFTLQISLGYMCQHSHWIGSQYWGKKGMEE